MSYDPARGQVLLFGGCDLSQCYNDTWVWNGTSWTHKVTGTAPSPRKYAAMAFDAATQTTILYSGFDGNSHGFFYGIGDTWSWDGSSWTHLTTANSPPPIYEGSMDYLPSATSLTLVGGTLNGDTFDTGTWIFNNSLTSPSWNRSPATDPPARARAALAFDPALGALALYGGVSCTQSPTSCSSLGDLWTFDGARWSNVAASGPPPRDSAALAYDNALGKLVLFGGENQVNSAGAYLNDTWFLNGTTWQQAAGSTGPSARRNAGMAYDPTNRQAVLFGGYDGSAALADTWTFDAGPTATSVNPSAFEQGSSGVPATIAGSGFISPVRVRVTGPSKGVKASVTSVSATQIEVRLTVPATAASGAYNLVVSNGDGWVARCHHCLTVGAAH
jgi:hypothetical protein